MTLIVQAARSMLSGMALLQQILPCMTRPRGATNTVRGFAEQLRALEMQGGPFVPTPNHSRRPGMQR